MKIQYIKLPCLQNPKYYSVLKPWIFLPNPMVPFNKWNYSYFFPKIANGFSQDLLRLCFSFIHLLYTENIHRIHLFLAVYFPIPMKVGNSCEKLLTINLNNYLFICDCALKNPFLIMMRLSVLMKCNLASHSSYFLLN